jgi:hypothetical protein
MSDIINRDGLSPMAAARLDSSLAKQFLYSGIVRTLGENLARLHASGELVSKRASDGMIDWRRDTFNRMNGREQAAYDARLKARRYYWIEGRDGCGHAVPKTVYDALALPVDPRSL